MNELSVLAISGSLAIFGIKILFSSFDDDDDQDGGTMEPPLKQVFSLSKN